MTDLESQLGEALRAGLEMRQAQARYFKLKVGDEQKREALIQSRQAESRFDSLARAAIRAFFSAEEVGR